MRKSGSLVLCNNPGMCPFEDCGLKHFDPFHGKKRRASKILSVCPSFDECRKLECRLYHPRRVYSPCKMYDECRARLCPHDHPVKNELLQRIPIELVCEIDSFLTVSDMRALSQTSEEFRRIWRLDALIERYKMNNHVFHLYDFNFYFKVWTPIVLSELKMTSTSIHIHGRTVRSQKLFEDTVFSLKEFFERYSMVETIPYISLEKSSDLNTCIFVGRRKKEYFPKEIGGDVDAMDHDGRWWNAVILDTDRKGLYHVHYRGWASEWDAWVDQSCLAPLFSRRKKWKETLRVGDEIEYKVYRKWYHGRIAEKSSTCVDLQCVINPDKALKRVDLSSDDIMPLGTHVPSIGAVPTLGVWNDPEGRDVWLYKSSPRKIFFQFS